MMEKKEKLLYIPSFILLGVLCFIDKDFIINNVFAAVFLCITLVCFRRESIRKKLYVIILFTSVMGAGLKIPLGNNPLLSQLNVYYIYIFIYFVILLLDIIKGRQKIDIKCIIKRPFYLIGILFMVYVYASIIWSGNKVLALKELVNYTAMFSLSIIVIIENITNEDRKITKRMLIYIMGGVLMYSTFKIITGIPIEPRSLYKEYEYFRDPSFNYVNRIPTVFFYNPNDYALVVGLIVMCLFISLIRYKKLDIKLGILFIVFIIGQVNLIFTSSRTAWIALGISCIFMMGLYLVKRQWKNLSRTIILILVSVLVFITFYNIPSTEIYFGKIKNVISKNVFSNKDRYLVSLNESLMASTSDDEQSEFKGIVGGQKSDNIRLMMSLNSVKYVFEEGNYLGAGAGNINEYNKIMGNTGTTYDSHNFWAELLGDFGIIGFGLFVTIYVSCFFKNLLRKSNNLSDLSLMLLVGCAFLVFGPSSIVGIAPLWIVLALIYSYTMTIKK